MTKRRTGNGRLAERAELTRAFESYAARALGDAGAAPLGEREHELWCGFIRDLFVLERGAGAGINGSPISSALRELSLERPFSALSLHADALFATALSYGAGGGTLAPSAERKRHGSFFTGAELADALAEDAALPLLRSRPRDGGALAVCDPACGAGSLLVAAAARAAAEGRAVELYGVDRDPRVVELCRLNLLALGSQGGYESIARRVRRGDSLLGYFADPRTEGCAADRKEAERWTAAALGPGAMHAAGLAFHWHLEFGDVWRRGGFDLVLSNPPWGLFLERRGGAAAELVRSFARRSQRYRSLPSSRLNAYPLFLELFRRIVRPTGRIGAIIPSGIATDAGCSALLQELLDRNELEQLFDFENRSWLFTDVATAGVKFSLAVLRPPAPDAAPPRFAFNLETLAARRDPLRQVALGPRELELLNPNTRTVSLPRTREDLALLCKLHERHAVLMDERRSTNPWGMTLRQGLCNMTSDRTSFAAGTELPLPGWVPLVESKMMHQFDHRWASWSGARMERTSDAGRRDSRFEVRPRFAVPRALVEERLGGWRADWLLVARSITRPTEVRTLLAAIVPRHAVANSLNVLLPSGRSATEVLALLGVLNSFVLDFAVRAKLPGTNLNHFILKQLPVPPPQLLAGEHERFLAPRVLELSYTSAALAPLARDAGAAGPPAAWDPARRRMLRAEIDAYVARRLFELSRDELAFMLSPQDSAGTAHPGETFRVLRARELATYGEFRTRREVLAAYDGLSGGGVAALAS